MTLSTSVSLCENLVMTTDETKICFNFMAKP